MPEILYLLTGLAVGGAVGFLFANSRTSVLKAQNAALRDDVEREKQNVEREKENVEREKQATEREKENAARERAAATEQMQTHLRLLEAQMREATQAMLKERSAALQEANTQQMNTLFQPLRDNLNRMERTLADTREKNERNAATLEQTIKNMLQQTQTLGERADNLADALRHKNKTAGNWGELVLSELLESQGLREGIHFSVQATLRDADGRALSHDTTGSRLVPDVILHLADQRDIVVDAKVSLAAYADYHEATTDAQRSEALSRHVASMRQHVRELSTKDYGTYILPPHQSAGFVIMFVPGEGALALALQEAPTLWRDAFEKKVFIATETTLLAALRIIDLTWVNVQQEQNTQKVMAEASKLLTRVEQFYRAFQEVGKCLTNAHEAYTAVQDKVRDGRQSILGVGKTLEKLGARGAKALPEIEEG